MKINVNIQDLMHIHTMAVNNVLELPGDSKMHKDNQQLQSYAYLMAVALWLNSKSIVRLDVELEKGL